MQIGFCDNFFKDHLPTIFTVFVIHGNVKDICTYLNILRTEGQVLCPAKHGSKESRELSAIHHLSSGQSFSMYYSVNRRISTETLCGRPCLHYYTVKYHANA